jgi:RES domain-containing protein
LSRVYRVLRKKYARNPFDGEGAYRYGGRWSSPGVRLSYTSEHESLALLEYFVHLDKDDPPADLILAVAEVPEDLSRNQIDLKGLPSGWRAPAASPELTQIGDEFVRRQEYCLLLVPSVLAPNEYNWLINPAHPECKRIAILDSQPVAYDPRMFGKSGRRQRH